MTLYTDVQHKLVSHQIWNNDKYQKTISAYSFEKRQFNILQLQKGTENRQYFPHLNK